MPEILLMLLLLGLLFAWYNGLAHREVAVRISKDACQRRGFQLLDGSVRLTSIGLARCPNGQRCLLRHYRFAYSSDHFSRNHGIVILKGKQLENIIFSDLSPMPEEPSANEIMPSNVYRFPGARDRSA